MSMIASTTERTSRHVSFATPAIPESVQLVRHMVAAALHTWKSPIDADVAELLVSEVFTNAVLYGMPTAPEVAARIVVEVVETLNGVHIEVHDPDQGASHVAAVARAMPRDESGRGLELVEALSSAWGQKSSGRGKYVYFDISALVQADEPAEVQIPAAQSTCGTRAVGCARGRSRPRITARIAVST